MKETYKREDNNAPIPSSENISVEGFFTQMTVHDKSEYAETFGQSLIKVSLYIIYFIPSVIKITPRDCFGLFLRTLLMKPLV